MEEKLSNYHINIIVVHANVSASGSLALYPNIFISLDSRASRAFAWTAFK